MIRLAQVQAARKRYRQIAPVLNEQSRRRFVALEARALGRGGVSLMARITGLARSMIYRGVSDIRNNVTTAPGRIRKEGGGRKKTVLEDPTLLRDLERLLEPAHARRPHAAAAVDLAQLAQSCEGPCKERPPGLSHGCRRSPARVRL